MRSETFRIEDREQRRGAPAIKEAPSFKAGAGPSMKRGIFLLVLLAALASATEDIESYEHCKAQATKLKAALRDAESTNEALAVKLKAHESTSKAAINAWKLKAQLAEESRLGESVGWMEKKAQERSKKRQAAEKKVAQKKAEAPTSLVAKAAAVMSPNPTADGARSAVCSGTQSWADYTIDSGPRPH